jgi:hypothetical protein
VTDHVSDLQWDRMLAAELLAAAGEAARTHAGECAACAARLRELTAERDTFRFRPIKIPLSRARRWRRWRRWARPLVPVLAAAAVLIVVRARPDGTHDPAGARTKGDGPALLLAAGRPGALEQLGTGDVIRSSDFLQAGYTSARDGFGAVLSRDGAGGVMAYVPFAGDAMVPLPAGVERSFPQSTILDDVLGSERIVIVWCETAYLLAPLLAELRAGREITSPGDCVVREVWLDKRAGLP